MPQLVGSGQQGSSIVRSTSAMLLVICHGKGLTKSMRTQARDRQIQASLPHPLSGSVGEPSPIIEKMSRGVHLPTPLKQLQNCLVLAINLYHSRPATFSPVGAIFLVQAHLACLQFNIPGAQVARFLDA